jgi:hypothetical protein
MKHSNVDALCAIAARLLEDAATLRELGCKKAAKLLQAAERELDMHVYAGGWREPAAGEVESTTHH